MNILVCISKSPDTTSKISFVNENTSFDENGVQFIVNPYDEWYALVRALEIKESIGGNVSIITVGTVSDEAVMRKALAIGADAAVRIDAVPTDAFMVAREIAHYAKDHSFDIILTGKETINYNGSQIGGMIAEFLNQPFVSLASKLDLNGAVLTLEQEILGGVQVLEVSTPVVISCAKGMAEQRIPNMRGIMAARTKPLEIITPSSIETVTSFDSYSMPDSKKACQLIDAANMDELVALLHNEAKVI
jgi:electron transfer flavoprotein beta subunit